MAFDQVVPICARCKKIRDAEGRWTQRQRPLNAPLNAVFTHGLCPDCVRELYPELADRLFRRQEAEAAPPLADTARKR